MELSYPDGSPAEGVTVQIRAELTPKDNIYTVESVSQGGLVEFEIPSIPMSAQHVWLEVSHLDPCHSASRHGFGPSSRPRSGTGSVVLGPAPAVSEFSLMGELARGSDKPNTPEGGRMLRKGQGVWLPPRDLPRWTPDQGEVQPGCFLEGGTTYAEAQRTAIIV